MTISHDALNLRKTSHAIIKSEIIDNPNANVKHIKTIENIYACGTPIGKQAYIDIDGNIWNIQTCKNNCLCTACHERIQHKRAAFARRCVNIHNGMLLLITLTISHEYSDSLQSTRDALFDAYHRFIRSKAFKSIENIGNIRTVETTYTNHGWHPHIHMLLFLGKGFDAKQQTIDVFNDFYAWYYGDDDDTYFDDDTDNDEQLIDVAALSNTWIKCVEKTGRNAIEMDGMFKL